MQGAVGAALLFIAVTLVWGIADEGKKSNNAVHRRYRYVVRHSSDTNNGFGFAIPRSPLIRASEAMPTVFGASEEYGVPSEVLLGHWYKESGMTLGGDQGGAGGHLALSTIRAKQRDPSERGRWSAFAKNERDILAICQHCGYDCNAIHGSSTGALGPMQFMPSTWKYVAVDANNDGKACPLDLADAMYSAARKLAGGYKQTRSWQGASLEYAGTNCAKNRAYVRHLYGSVIPKMREIIRRYRANKQKVLASTTP